MVFAVLAVACGTGAGTEPGASAVTCTASSSVRTTDKYAEVPLGVDVDLLSLDVYRPELPDGCGPAPVLVWVHGGGWQTGDKSNKVSDKVALAEANGWVFVAVNYRLAPAVQYPAFDDDVAAAIGWIVDHAGELGADTSRIALMGHSAGGGIVSAVSTDERHLETVGLSLSDVACTVSLDTEGYDVAAGASGRGAAVYEPAFGSNPAVWADASPVHNVAPGKGIPPFLVVTRGLANRIEVAQTFADILTAAGIDATVVDANPYTHEDVNDAVGDPTDETITPTLVTFLDDCFS